ncbi:MAG: Sulfotransferase family protein [Mucilaginibacter sp.]|nr:Sulfotransferase family protein [Mucilaginibacter sp.]
MSKSDYSAAGKLLHRVALQSKAIAEMSFDIESMLVNEKKAVFSNQHIFISGLARSGTTMLMRYLYETGVFRSLTYQDMPFVLMPNTWKQMSHQKPAAEYKERAHKDGIMVGFDSPEAFEEVFWRVFCGEQYIGKDRLKPHTVDNDVLAKFKTYVRNILLSGDGVNQTRYLSKNNNNVLRFRYLRQCLPQSQIIIPFREPLQHAVSLLNQHEHFSKVQSEDKFSLDYMNWLGHFEFGLNQKSFDLNDEETFAAMAGYDKMDINFWLLNWKNYYKYVNDQCPENSVFFNYEKFCSYPASVLGRLFSKLHIVAPCTHLEPFTPQFKQTGQFDMRLLEECNAIYKQLEIKFDKWYID